MCGECPNCYDLSVYRLRDILYAIDDKISQYSRYIICKLKWGYGCKESLNEDDFEKLLSYKNSLERYYNSLRDKYEFCLCPEEVQEIIEKTLDIVDIGCCSSTDRSDMEINESNLDSWILKNPGCVAYHKWERKLVKACPLVGINVKSVDKSCDIVTAVNMVEDKCKFLSTISVYSVANACIKTKVVINKHDCRLEYKALVKEHKCDLKFNTYLKLIECNMTTEIISSFLSCGISVGYNVRSKCPELTIGTNTSLILCDLDVNIFSGSVDNNLLSEFSNGEIDSYEVDKLIDSYINSCEIIKNEINGI